MSRSSEALPAFVLPSTGLFAFLGIIQARPRRVAPSILPPAQSSCALRSEMPHFQQKYLELGQQVQFLMVNMTDGSQETKADASAFIADKGYTFPVLYDTDMDGAITYEVYSLPITFFIDAQGNLVAYSSGAISSETLQKGIDMIR